MSFPPLFHPETSRHARQCSPIVIATPKPELALEYAPRSMRGVDCGIDHETIGRNFHHLRSSAVCRGGVVEVCVERTIGHERQPVWPQLKAGEVGTTHWDNQRDMYQFSVKLLNFDKGKSRFSFPFFNSCHIFALLSVRDNDCCAVTEVPHKTKGRGRQIRMVLSLQTPPHGY
jgi:hypothetical protein